MRFDVINSYVLWINAYADRAVKLVCADHIRFENEAHSVSYVFLTMLILVDILVYT